MTEKFKIHTFTHLNKWPFEDTPEAMSRVNKMLPEMYEVMRAEKGEPGYYLVEYEGEE